VMPYHLRWCEVKRDGKPLERFTHGVVALGHVAGRNERR
jgi:hypothetical protein